MWHKHPSKLNQCTCYADLYYRRLLEKSVSLIVENQNMHIRSVGIHIIASSSSSSAKGQPAAFGTLPTRSSRKSRLRRKCNVTTSYARNFPSSCLSEEQSYIRSNCRKRELSSTGSVLLFISYFVQTDGFFSPKPDTQSDRTLKSR